MNDEEYIEKYTPNKLYGLAIYNRYEGKWKYYIGTFPYLYGIYQISIESNDMLSEINSMLYDYDIFNYHLDNRIKGLIFYDLSINKIINTFLIYRNQGLDFLFTNNEYDDEYLYLENLSYINDPDNKIQSLNFENKK